MAMAQFSTAAANQMVPLVRNPVSARGGTIFNERTVQPDADSTYAKEHGRTYNNASPLAISPAKEQRFSRDSAISGAVSVGKPDSSPSLFISSEDVLRRVSANDDFLSRRQSSRTEFQEQLRAEFFLGVRNLPRDSIRMNRNHGGSQSVASAGPSFGSWTPSAKGYDSTVSTLAATLRLPGYGVNVAYGIEAVREEGSSNHSNGLMLADKRSQSTPAASFRSVDCLMRHDSSFYAYGGFCEGAKMMLRGEKDFYKIMKRPVVRVTGECTDILCTLLTALRVLNLASYARYRQTMYPWSTEPANTMLRSLLDASSARTKLTGPHLKGILSSMVRLLQSNDARDFVAKRIQKLAFILQKTTAYAIERHSCQNATSEQRVLKIISTANY
jgi:hypothetical protein